jgi:cytoskeletal protein CcmA (bactofilin family)
MSTGGGGGGSCPPANVIIASNVLDTNGNVIAGNIFSQDGTFSGNLYVAGSIVGNISYASLNVSGTINASSFQGGTFQGGLFFGNGSGLSNLNASNLSGSANLTSLNTTSLSFQNAILNTNLPILNTAQGTWGSSSNASQVTIDQYGRVSAAANIAITSSQWTTIHGNVAYGNGVSIGTISDPPPGSNLYVLGTANIDTLNVSTLFANSFGLQTLNTSGTSNLNIVYGQAYYGNGSGLSNLNASNLAAGIVNSSLIYGNTLSNIAGSNVTGNVANANVALVVSQPAQPNITSVGTLTGLNVQGLLIASDGSGISNLNSSNLVGNVANANVALVVSQPSQPNITSVGTLTGLNVQGLLIASDGSGISNLNSSNLVGNVANANVALVVSQASQPNITSVGTLTGLNVSGLLITSNGSGISNLNSSNLVGNVANANVALVVSQPSQPNITSVGTLTGLNVSGLLIASNGSGISNLNSSNLVGNVANANVALVVSQPAQPNITSVGTLTGLNVSGLLIASDGSGISNLNSSNLVGNVANANVALVVSQPAQPNITSVGTLTGLNVSGLLIASNGSGISNLNSSNLVGNVANANVALVVSQASQPNITSVGTLSGLNVQGLLVASNGSGISNINWSNIVQPFGNLVVSNSITTTNVVATLANLVTLNVSSVETAGNVVVSNSITVSNLSVSGNIIPVTQGNTYVQGNVVVAGNVYSSLGQLGAGGGYYLSLPTDIAVQPVYNGPVYGATYPLSIGLSNGFTINGTSTLITITSNGNFKFSQAGPYILNAVFNSSDNITGLAVGSNVADIHGQDQGYLYRYTTFVSQNPTEVIKIPINVTNTSLYYYLDLFKVDAGTIYSSSNTSGGTYLTITPLTGGGLATGGPGGTPGTQWISSGSNIYFPNSVGVGAVNPQYNLDVSGDVRATGNVYSANPVLSGRTTSYSVGPLDYYIGMSNGQTINLPLGSTLTSGKQYIIKDESGLAGTFVGYRVTVATSSPDLIDGQNSVILAINYGAINVIWTGSFWSIY